MKILMVNKFLYPNGGSETYIFKLGEYLSSCGHEVEYFGMEHPDNKVSNSAELYTENMDFHNSSALKKIKLSLKTIYSKEAYEKMLRVLESFKPDVVHLNNFNFQLTPSIICTVEAYDRKCGTHTRLVYTAHDYQLICPNHMMYDNNTHKNCEKCVGGNFTQCTKNKCIHSSLLKSAIGTAEAKYYNSKGTYKRLDKIICCSEFMKAKLDTNPIFRQKTVTLHNFTERAEKKTVEKEGYILYFGRYAYEKGINTLLEAKNIKFICAGSGPLEDKIHSSENMTDVGFKTGEELEMLIRKARCTVYPSICYENCPFSLLESIMFGTPVVASKIGGIPELVDDGKTGILIEPDNASALESAIKNITDDEARRMSASCLEKSFDTVEEYAQKLLKIYTA